MTAVRAGDPRGARKPAAEPQRALAASRASLHRPDLRFEKELLRTGCARLAAIDEVGRGALAGPVSVGAVVITSGIGRVPAGLRDSKLLTPPARQALVPLIRRWVVEYAVGHASAEEIDQIGIIGALRLAGRRALTALSGPVDAVLLDGSHDYLSDPEPGLFEAEDIGADVGEPGWAALGPDGLAAAQTSPDDAFSPTMPALNQLIAQAFVSADDDDGSGYPSGRRPCVTRTADSEVSAAVSRLAPAASVPTRAVLPLAPVPPRIHTRIKADLTCAAVAGASVLAKTERDCMLVELDMPYPLYQFAINKGYGTPEHLAALRRYGPSEVHRRSWRLPAAGASAEE